MAWHAQSTQNNKFPISLQHLKKGVINEVDLLHANKHDNLLQIDTMTLMGLVKHLKSYLNSKFAMSLQYLKKEARVEVNFFACR